MTADTAEKRREPRHPTNHAVTFSHLNKEEHYIGIAHNISRSGMFFRTSRELKPGNCIVILPLDCRATDLLWGDSEHGLVAASFCALDQRPDGGSRRQLVHMVTAEVTRCEPMEAGDRLRFGIAVDYLRPTV